MEHNLIRFGQYKGISTKMWELFDIVLNIDIHVVHLPINMLGKCLFHLHSPCICLL